MMYQLLQLSGLCWPTEGSGGTNSRISHRTSVAGLALERGLSFGICPQATHSAKHTTSMKVFVTLLLAIAAAFAVADVQDGNTEFDINKVSTDPNAACRFNPPSCRKPGRALRKQEDEPVAAPAPLL
jgi:hypothetical protein